MLGDIPVILVSLVVFLLIFFAFFLITFKKGDRVVKQLLGVFFLSIGLSVTDIYLNFSSAYEQFPHIAFILNPLLFIYGPLLLLITKTLTGELSKVKISDLMHFIPLGSIILILLFSFHLQDIEFKKEFISRSTNTNAFSTLMSSFVFFVYTAIYMLFSFKLLYNYRDKLKDQVSDISNLKLAWLEYILWWFLVIILGSLIIQVISITLGSSQLLNFMIGFLLSAVLVFIMGSITRGLKSDINFSKFVKEEQDTRKVKDYDPNKLEQLRVFMGENKPYLDPQLTLTKLAHLVNEKPRTLSSLINNGTKKTFFDFVNVYRINHFKQVIEESTDQQMTILEVMYLSGFNSKSSFNSAFKKINGQTPSQWKKTITS